MSLTYLKETGEKKKAQPNWQLCFQPPQDEVGLFGLWGSLGYMGTNGDVRPLVESWSSPEDQTKRKR